METTEHYHLMKCWLDIEQFKAKLMLSGTEDYDNHKKINRTQSFDLRCKCYPHKQDKKLKHQRFSWKDSNDVFPSILPITMSECSTSSCRNLSEQIIKKDCTICGNSTSVINPTEDAIEIFKKYVAIESPFGLDLPDGLRKSVITNICEPEGKIKADCFQPAQDVIFKQIESLCFHDFLISPFFIKAQIDILTNCSLDLNDILYSESILFYFTEFLEQESCRVLLEFLMAINNFRDNLANICNEDNQQAQADAIVIYDKYFSLQATHPIGFPTDIRLKIESEICREGGPLTSCFDLPYRIVFKTLTQYVKTFLESELYYKFLSEMIYSVNHMWSNNQKSHSDCSSEFSISTQNTLLAMGDPFFRKKKRNLSVPDMTIDSNQLYNADSLWQRNRQDGLSLGRVNSLGRFESKFEPDPDKKGKSVFKKMVSHFVPTNTSKVEEEMAWQIAHMIVKDITDLTMAPPDSERDDI